MSSSYTSIFWFHCKCTLNVNTDKGVPSVCSLVRRRIIVKFLAYILLAEGYILLAEGPGVAREKKHYEKIMKKNK